MKKLQGWTIKTIHWLINDDSVAYAGYAISALLMAAILFPILY